ncbi:MAG: hypothetical protein WC058_11210 [Phycisphaeraceae bacterium]
MVRQSVGLISVIGLVAATMALLLWPGAGLIHSGPAALIGAGLLAGALMKYVGKYPRLGSRG